MWWLNLKGQKEFSGGKENWGLAALVAEKCPLFTVDDEDELVADDPKSCYNCRYRRWTPLSFVCLKQQAGPTDF